MLQARSNPLLTYLQALEASQLTTLTSTAQTDTLEAVNSVVHSVMQASAPLSMLAADVSTMQQHVARSASGSDAMA